MDKNSIEK